VSKFAEIKIFPIILVPSLNSTIVDLILTVLNQIAMVNFQLGPDLNYIRYVQCTF